MLQREIPGKDQAVTGKQPAFGKREDVWIKTACDMCYNTCSIQVHRVDGVAVKIEGVPEAPPNHGTMCAKGNSALMNLYNPHRIKTPLLRTNPEKGIKVDPGWKEITWDEALDLLVEKLKAVRARDPRGLVGASFDIHSLFMLAAFLGSFGSPNFTAGAAGYFCGNGVHPIAYMLTGANDTHPDLPLCDYLLMFGTSYGFVAQANAMPLAKEMAEARARGLKLVVIDPVCTYAASKADEWIPIRPGTDAAFALALMHVLVNELGCYDAEFLKTYTNSPYLIGPDGYYVREGESGKPLVWDGRVGRAVAYDVVEPRDATLEGSYQVEDKEVRPGFQLFREHLRGYPPEKAAEITTVPAATIRRVAGEFGKAARIGATINLEGHELPHRPVAAIWYRGISAHKHGMLNGMSVGLLNALIGAVDVPGGILNASGAGPNFGPTEGPDGLMATGNPFTWRIMRPSLPKRKVRRPETLMLVDLFPVSVYAQTLFALGVLQGREFGLTYQAELLIHCRTNLIANGGDPEVMAEALRRIPFMVSLATHHDETTVFADLVLPDTHALERLMIIQAYYLYSLVPMTLEDHWNYRIQQPVVEPQGRARFWVEVLMEVADRLGTLSDFYATFNAIAQLEGPYRLDPTKKYTWEEVCDRWARCVCGEDRGLDYLREHGYYPVARRDVRQTYPRVFHRGRIPLYLEHFLAVGEEVREYMEERRIPWDTSDYVPLVAWHPCPAHTDSPPEYDLFVVNQKLPFLTFSFTSENAWLMELADRNTKVFPVGINAETARRKGIADGDTIVLETPGGFKVSAIARLSQGIHPECLAVPGILGRQVTDNERARGRGVHFNQLLEYTMERIDTLSAALDACVKVKVSR